MHDSIFFGSNFTPVLQVFEFWIFFLGIWIFTSAFHPAI